MKGRFITIEGVDGSGKSTQIKLLHQYLIKKGIDVVLSHEPGGTRIGEQIRNILLNANNLEMIPLTEVFLYEAARAQHVGEVILPALNTGKTVLCSRFADSTLAYQGHGGGMDMAILAMLNEIASCNLKPDLTLVFDFDPGSGLNRVTTREDQKGAQRDRMEQKNLDFHRRVRNGFLALAKIDPDRIHIIDASGTIEEVFAKTIVIVDQYLQQAFERRSEQ
jgi:dTMP kinase